jgi:predicted transcriptional regulator
MTKKKSKALSILIGGDIKGDYKELFSGKPITEILQPRNTLYLESYEQLDKLLSPKRMDLLRHLMERQINQKPESVSQLAKVLNRHQEAISRDVSYLKKIGLVILKQVKQTVYAFPLYTSIDIQIR